MGQFTRRLRSEEGASAPLPLPPGPVSNGEFVPWPATSRDRSVERLIRDAVDEAARRGRIDRRSFMKSAGAVAASLAAFELAGCSSPASSARATTSTMSPGGTYTVPPTTDRHACEVALGGSGEFIFDVHTHYATPGGPWVHNAPETVGLILGMLPAGCIDADRLDCVNQTAYLHDVFLASDTTMAMLTDVPNSGPSNAPVPFPQAIRTEEITAELTHGGAGRLLVENVIAPNVGPLGACLDEMTAAVETHRLSAFKVYTAWSPTSQGYSLEDPAIGLPTVQHAHDLGVKVFVAHKGLPLVNFDPAFNHPDDVVAVSRQFPDMNFVIYHAAWDPSYVEGPYNPSATVGIDSLLSALDRHGVPPNDNIWVDTAAMWRQLLTLPDQAAHALGKLLKRVGEQRVMWGTDAIWFGSPQPQIMAMRAFQITPEFQHTYGYAALTPEVKRRIFGLNGAELFGVDPTAARCGLTGDTIDVHQAEAAALRADGALPSPWVPRGPVTRREVLSWLRSSPWTPV
ncbi:MAG TPA: amidohydrolase family protein [Acidimicrobiales bacterium]|nr:amidohydrolase family protein [Acidimicrobiales bacterium]